jgi:hypothetical protein
VVKKIGLKDLKVKSQNRCYEDEERIFYDILVPLDYHMIYSICGGILTCASTNRIVLGGDYIELTSDELNSKKISIARLIDLKVRVEARREVSKKQSEIRKALGL